MSQLQGTIEQALYRSPDVRDAAEMWRMAADLPLDVNSPYAYLAICRDFCDTSIVAELDGNVVGFVTGYRPRRAPDTLFIWQVGVKSLYQSGGIAKGMLNALLAQPDNSGVEYLEATVTPSNVPSGRLFRSLAKSLDAECQVGPCFARDLFPDAAHEPEDLYRIGPIECP